VQQNDAEQHYTNNCTLQFTGFSHYNQATHHPLLSAIIHTWQMHCNIL